MKTDKHGYDRKYIRSLFNFIDLVFRLPEGLEKKLSEEISKIEEEHKMAYVTSWERIAKKEGIREGKREGIREGKRETAQRMIKKGIDKETIIEVTGFSREELETLSQTVH